MMVGIMTVTVPVMQVTAMMITMVPLMKLIQKTITSLSVQMMMLIPVMIVHLELMV